MIEKIFVFCLTISIANSTHQYNQNSIYDPLNLFTNQINKKIVKSKLNNKQDRQLHGDHGIKKQITQHKNQFEQDYENYLSNLNNENICEHSLLNMLTISDLFQKNHPPFQSSVSQRRICPLLLKSCCTDEYFSNYEVYSQSFFEKYYEEYKELKIFLKQVQNIDMAVWNHYMRKKGSDDNQCYQNQHEKIIEAVKIMNDNHQSILDGYELFIKSNFQYIRQFRCSQCGARKQRRFIMDPIHHKFIIKIHPSEVYKYLIYSQKSFHYKKFLVLANFLQCLNNQQNTTDDEESSKFRITLLEELPDYQKKVSNIDQIFEDKDFYQRFKENYQVTIDYQIQPKQMFEFLKEVLSNKESNISRVFVKKVSFWRTKLEQLSFNHENIDYQLTDGTNTIEGFVKAEYEKDIKFENDFFEHMEELYIKKAWIMISSLLISIIF